MSGEGGRCRGSTSAGRRTKKLAEGLPKGLPRRGEAALPLEAGYSLRPIEPGQRRGARSVNRRSSPGSPTPMSTQVEPLLAGEEIERASAWTGELARALGEVIVGQEKLVESLLIGLLTGGHVLLEGVPGLAKSLAVASLARAVRGSFARLQFTPDLLPSDLVGTEIYNAKEGSFTVRRGPIFANFVLADEINRAPAKVQSALLEAMQERQVSIGGQTFLLPRPFLVLATQNPIEQEGTYPLPEAQVDRFALKVVVGYPRREEELLILQRMAPHAAGARACARSWGWTRSCGARTLVDRVALDGRLAEYIVSLVHATREPEGRGLAGARRPHPVRRLARARRSGSRWPRALARSCAGAAT